MFFVQLQFGGSCEFGVGVDDIDVVGVFMKGYWC